MSFVPILNKCSKFEIYSRLSPEEFARQLFDRVKPDLEEAYMNNRWRHNMQYIFSGTFYRFIWNGFNRFNGIKKCSLLVDKNLGQITLHAKYDFSEVFILCLLFTMIPILDLWGMGAHRLILILLIWLVYFINFFVSNFRLNRYFKEKVQQTFLDCDKTYHKKLL